MITVHHLENSRSQRILWLLEELQLPYEVKRYERDKKTMLAPPALARVHPLGKAPVIEDQGRAIAETGAIVEYLVEKGEGRLGAPCAVCTQPVRGDEVGYELQFAHQPHHRRIEFAAKKSGDCSVKNANDQRRQRCHQTHFQ